VNRELLKITLLTTMATLAACGGSNGNGGSNGSGVPSDDDEPSTGDAGGPTGFAPGDVSDGAAPLNPQTGQPTVFGSWLLANGATSEVLTLNDDGTYEIDIIVSTSTVTGDEYVQQGNFALNGANITFTPTQASCPTALTPSTDTYAFDAQYLVLTNSSGSATYAATDASSFGNGLSLVVGCSPSGQGWTPEPLTGSPPSAGNPGAEPTLYGNWLATSGTTSVEVMLNSDGTYEIDLLITTSAVTGDEYVQQGTFVLNGADITFTPTEASCPGSVPVFADGYLFNGAGLVTTSSSGTTTGYAPTGSTPLGQGLTLVVGCSQDNGPWTPQPLAPVTN